MINFIHTKIKKLYAQPTSNNKPDNFKENKVAYIRYQFKQHFWRWLRYSTIGATTTALGFLILYLAVSNIGLKPVFGYLIENAITLQVGFLLNRRLSFADRENNWFRSLIKWYTARATMFGIGQGVFWLLVSIFGFQYMLASLTLALSFGLIDYAICNIFTFSNRRLAHSAA